MGFPSNLNSKQSAESQLLLLQRVQDRTQFSLTTKLFSLLLKPPSQRPNNQQEPINQSLLDLHKAADAKGDAHLCDFIERSTWTSRLRASRKSATGSRRSREPGTVLESTSLTRRLEAPKLLSPPRNKPIRTPILEQNYSFSLMITQ